MKVNQCTLVKPLACDVDTSVLDVAKQLKQAAQRRIIITENEKPIGIVSTTDMNNRVVAAGKDPSKMVAKDIMSQLLLVADMDESVEQTFQKMDEHKSYFVPVTKDNALLGVLTYGEVCHRLESCIHGR